MSPAGPPSFALVTGAPRTGTTAVARWLGQHPDVQAFLETRILVAAQRFIDTADRFKATNAHMGFLLESTRSTAMAFYERCATVQGVSLVVDKEPLDPIAFPDRSYGSFLDSVERVFPDARFVVMLRDPVDTVASMSRRTWGSSLKNSPPRVFSVDEHITTWQASAQMIVDRFGSPETMVCVYERLVADPETVSTELVEFLDLVPAPPFSPKSAGGPQLSDEIRNTILEATRPQRSLLADRGVWDYDAADSQSGNR